MARNLPRVTLRSANYFANLLGGGVPLSFDGLSSENTHFRYPRSAAGSLPALRKAIRESCLESHLEMNPNE